MAERSRSLLDFAGLVILAASLIFVAFQMQQDRKIALAQLNTSALEMVASRQIAGIESDAYLTMYSKLYATKAWDRADLDEREAAAAELDAIVWLTYFEMCFEHYREALMEDEAWAEVRSEMQAFLALPVVRAVYDVYWRRAISSDFIREVNALLEDA